MADLSERKSSHSVALVVGILLTCLAMVGHRFLPERRFALDGSQPGSFAYLTQSDDGAPADIQWVDKSRFHVAWQFPQATVDQRCSFGYPLHAEDVSVGTDLS